MSSRRFPGKMLAPLCGRPLITHVLARVCEALPRDRVIMLTSKDVTDDPLAGYVSALAGVTVFRGDLDDVVARFQACLRAYPCKWFVRICGDSPAIDPGLLAWMLERRSDEVDLLTNVAERTFPPGESIEIVRTSKFLEWLPDELTPEEREHVTQHFYRNPARFRIRNVSADDLSLAGRRLVVDTLDDLRALERILTSEAGLTRGYASHARLGQRAA